MQEEGTEWRSGGGEEGYPVTETDRLRDVRSEEGKRGEKDQMEKKEQKKV